MVAAVLLGSVFSTLFAGLLADWMGRKPLMVISCAVFVLSIPEIALSQSYSALFLGRPLQGVGVDLSGSSCHSTSRSVPVTDLGKGTGIFRWLPIVGKYGYSRMFFLFASFTVIYFLVVAASLPQTKGKTLEEIEAHFEVA
jgi:MFS family permease